VVISSGAMGKLFTLVAVAAMTFGTSCAQLRPDPSPQSQKPKQPQPQPDPVRYVSTNGSDSNDGLSLDTAMADIYSAWNSLYPGGGTIYVLPGSPCGGPVANQGLWITGSASPATGWLGQMPVQVIGIGTTSYIPNSSEPATNVKCGGPDPSLAELRFSGTDRPMRLENLEFDGGYIGFIITGSTGLTFENVQWNIPFNNGSAGPTGEIGGSSFWLWFDHCTFQADNVATLDPPGPPVLGQVSGGGPGATVYYVKTTYVNARGETVGSGESSLAVLVGNVLTVTSPPVVLYTVGPTSTSGALAYNVYVSTSPGAETQQNASPIRVGTNWTEPGAGLVSGAPPPTSSTAKGGLKEQAVVFCAASCGNGTGASNPPPGLTFITNSELQSGSIFYNNRDFYSGGSLYVDTVTQEQGQDGLGVVTINHSRLNDGSFLNIVESDGAVHPYNYVLVQEESNTTDAPETVFAEQTAGMPVFIINGVIEVPTLSPQ
jgi:hypothetical protein